MAIGGGASLHLSAWLATALVISILRFFFFFRFSLLLLRNLTSCSVSLGSLNEVRRVGPTNPLGVRTVRLPSRT